MSGASDFVRQDIAQPVDDARRVMVRISGGHAVVELSESAVRPLRWTDGGTAFHGFDEGREYPERYEEAKAKGEMRRVEERYE